MIELSDNAMNIIRESQNGQPLQFVNPDYRNYQYNFSLAASTTQITMPIPAKFSSLKSIFVTARDTAKSCGVLTFFPYSCNKFSISSYFSELVQLLCHQKYRIQSQKCFQNVLKQSVQCLI